MKSGDNEIQFIGMLNFALKLLRLRVFMLDFLSPISDSQINFGFTSFLAETDKLRGFEKCLHYTDACAAKIRLELVLYFVHRECTGRMF